MSVFPETPTLLLTRIAMQATGEDAKVWMEFFELYTPAMNVYLVARGVDRVEAEDVVQEVLMKLVAILREGKYDRERSRFRTYLSRLLYNEMIDHHRRTSVWREHSKLQSEQLDDATGADSDAGYLLDLEWARARHAAVIAHILEKTALSEQSKRVYRELERTGESCAAVAKRLQLPAATVRQIKSRVDRMVVALEGRLANGH